MPSVERDQLDLLVHSLRQVDPVETVELTAATAESKSGDEQETAAEKQPCIHIATEGAPLLRLVADCCKAAEFTGKIVVEAADQAWTLTFREGEARTVERTDGEYTVLRMSRIERLFHALSALAVFLGIGAIITGLASLLLATPFGFVDSLIGLVGAIVLFIVSFGLWGVSPGMSRGKRVGDPGDGLPGFEQLSPVDQAAFEAIDDEKSLRNWDFIRHEHRLPASLLQTGLWAYIYTLAYLNWAGWGVLILAGLVATWRLLGILAMGSGSRFETLEDDRVEELLENVHAVGNKDRRPTLQTLGDESNPVYENIAMAIPTTDAIVIPEAAARKLRTDELKALLAHEYKHLATHPSHYLATIELVLLLAPGIALIVVTPSLGLLQFGIAMYVYLVVLTTLTSSVIRRWEAQADDFAAEVTSPLSVAHLLNRLTPRQVVDAPDEHPLSATVKDMHNSHPMCHRRIVRLLEQEFDAALDGTSDEAFDEALDGTSDEAYAGQLEGTFTGTFDGKLKGTFDGEFEGTYEEEFEDAFEGSFEGKFKGKFEGTFEGEFEDTFEDTFDRE